MSLSLPQHYILLMFSLKACVAANFWMGGREGPKTAVVLGEYGRYGLHGPGNTACVPLVAT